MRAARRLPFQNLTSDNWLNLAIAGMAVFWLAQIGLDLGWQNVFGRFASDASAFWTAGYLANHDGYQAVYDLNLMAQAQQPLVPKIADSSAAFHPRPTAYLPVFIVPFQALALLPPVPAAFVWILLNTAGIALYLWSFTRRALDQPLPFRLLALLFVSAPVFLNIFTGQVNLALLVGIGEFLLAARRQQPLCSGLWLGLLLIKPQTLVLLLPALLLQLQWKALIGVMISAIAILGASFLLAGQDGLRALAQLWLGYSSGAGLPTSDLSIMMNWRMLGLHLSAIAPSSVAAGVTYAGIALTALAALSMWTRRLESEKPEFVVALLGLLAASGAIAWHSHVHTAVLLLPMLVVLYLEHRELLGSVLEWWVFLPASLYFVRLVLASAVQLGVLPVSINGFLDLLAGIGMFVMNLYVLFWALRKSRALRQSA